MSLCGQCEEREGGGRRGLRRVEEEEEQKQEARREEAWRMRTFCGETIADCAGVEERFLDGLRSGGCFADLACRVTAEGLIQRSEGPENLSQNLSRGITSQEINIMR